MMYRAMNYVEGGSTSLPMAYATLFKLLYKGLTPAPITISNLGTCGAREKQENPAAWIEGLLLPVRREHEGEAGWRESKYGEETNRILL